VLSNPQSLSEEFAQRAIELEAHLKIFCAFQGSPSACENGRAVGIGQRISRLNLSCLCRSARCERHDKPARLAKAFRSSFNYHRLKRLCEKYRKDTTGLEARSYRPTFHMLLPAGVFSKFSPTQLVFSCVWELKVCPARSEHQLEKIAGARPVIELSEAARALAEVVQAAGFCCVQVSLTLECLRIEKVAEPFSVPAIVERSVVAQRIACSHHETSVTVPVEARSSHDIEYSAEAIPKLSREAARYNVH